MNVVYLSTENGIYYADYAIQDDLSTKTNGILLVLPEYRCDGSFKRIFALERSTKWIVERP